MTNRWTKDRALDAVKKPAGSISRDKTVGADAEAVKFLKTLEESVGGAKKEVAAAAQRLERTDLQRHGTGTSSPAVRTTVRPCRQTDGPTAWSRDRLVTTSHRANSAIPSPSGSARPTALRPARIGAWRWRRPRSRLDLDRYWLTVKFMKCTPLSSSAA